MPSITIIVADTPDGSVSIHSSFVPAVGHPCSPAQAHALDIIGRTHKQWGLPKPATPAQAVCNCAKETAIQDAASRVCIGCGGVAA